MELIKHEGGYYYHPSATIGGGAKIGEGVIISKETKIGEEVTIGKGTIVYEGATIGEEATIGDWVKVREGAIIEGGVTIAEYTSIGDCTIIGKRTKIGRFITIGEYVEIGEGAIINRSPICIRNRHYLNEYCQGKVSFGCKVLNFTEWYDCWEGLCKKYNESPEWFEKEILPIIKFIEEYQKINPLDGELKC